MVRHVDLPHALHNWDRVGILAQEPHWCRMNVGNGTTALAVVLVVGFFSEVSHISFALASCIRAAGIAW